MSDELEVLIIDDDRATVDMICNKVAWEKLGITRIHTAYNIDTAKQILQENRVQIIVSDIEMPQGSGLDLLEWFRQKKIEGEFLLLTCHERFDYASSAVRLHASEYLLKPFNVEVMEAALRKIIQKLQEEELLKENSEYGKWVKNSQRQLTIAFWNRVFLGHDSHSEREIRNEIQKQKLDIDPDRSCRIIVSRVTNAEKDKVRMNPDLLLFIMENIHSEVLCGNPENQSVLCYDYNSYYTLVTVYTGDDSEIGERTGNLIRNFKSVLESDITCCISSLYRIWELNDVFRKNMSLIESNVGFYGTFFAEDEGIEKGSIQNQSLLDFELLESMLNGKQKMEFLRYLKQQFSDRLHQNLLSEESLLREKQEILQAVYTYLGKRGMPVSGLLTGDETLSLMTEKASQSVTDMIRWSGYLWDKVFLYEKSILEEDTVTEKVNRYIREHYREDISRNEIAAELFMAPEYLSKLYKKQTGKGLKDVLNEYRIQEAEILLEKGMRVSDVAENVGFDSFTYFSTMFKKYTGISPNKYRRKQ